MKTTVTNLKSRVLRKTAFIAIIILFFYFLDSLSWSNDFLDEKCYEGSKCFSTVRILGILLFLAFIRWAVLYLNEVKTLIMTHIRPNKSDKYIADFDNQFAEKENKKIKIKVE